MEQSSGAKKACETPGCDKTASLQCPTCIKLGIDGSFFCTQECFKGVWDDHKLIHKKAKAKAAAQSTAYNPWPGFRFTGTLRPFPVVQGQSCRRGVQAPMRSVPDHIERPDYATHAEGYPASERAVRGSTNIVVLNDDDQEMMRVAGRLGREVLDVGAQAVAAGVTTDELDRLIHEVVLDLDKKSVNEVICHGIPDARPLENGDIVNIDVTTYHRGFHGDLNETFFVGEVDDKYKKLVRVTHECLQMCINEVKPGVRYREMGNIIQKHAQSHGYSVVRSYCGHGIHRLFHTAPSVPHYAKNKGVGVMKPGHTFTIEPMISEGTWRDETWPDNWTAVTQDGLRSAQFEHTLLVTEEGVEVLTRRRVNDGQPWFMDAN